MHEWAAPAPGAPFPWQDERWQSLMDALTIGRLAHAILISGLPGSGKRSLAERLAQALLCRERDGRPCGRCRSCELWAAGTHPDQYLITPPEDKNQIQVDQVRQLIGDLQLHSHGGHGKVGLVVPADAMRDAAANCLLKTLEEPPAGTLLILVTSRPAALLATVRSRCQHLEIGSPSRAAALDWLAGHGGSEHDWPTLLNHSGGAPLEAATLAQSGFDQLAHTLSEDLSALIGGRVDPVRLAEAWLKHDGPATLRWLHRWTTDVIIAAQLGTDEAGQLPRTVLQKMGRGIDLEGLHGYLSEVQRAIRLLDTPVNKQLLLEALLIPWTEGIPSATGNG